MMRNWRKENKEKVRKWKQQRESKITSDTKKWENETRERINVKAKTSRKKNGRWEEKNKRWKWKDKYEKRFIRFFEK